MSLVNITLAPAPAPIGSVVSMPIPLIMDPRSEVICTNAKQALEDYVNSQFWGLCKENVCHLGARHWISYLSKDRGCAFNLSSIDRLGGTLDIGEKGVSFEINQDNQKFTASSDFESYIKAQWALETVQNFMDIGEDGFFYIRSRIKPVAGEISLQKGQEDGKEFIDLSIENEGNKIGGRCYLGSNFIECEAKDKSFIEGLFSGKVRATYSKEVNAEGVELLKVDLETVSVLPFSFLSSKLGSFYAEMDPKTGQFNVNGDLAKILAGEFSCSNNPDGESCKGNAKVFDAKIELSTLQKLTPKEKEDDFGGLISRFSLNVTDTTSNKKMMGVGASYENRLSLEDCDKQMNKCLTSVQSGKAEVEVDNTKFDAQASSHVSFGGKSEHQFSAEATDISTQEKLFEAKGGCATQDSFMKCNVDYTKKDGTEHHYYAKVPG